MAGRITALDTRTIRRFAEEMEIKAAIKAERVRASLFRKSAVVDFDAVEVPSNVVEKDVSSYSQYEEAVDESEGIRDDDGYCYTAMAEGAQGLASMQVLGPSPHVEELLASPLKWFAYPLVGAVVSTGPETCRIRCGEGMCGVDLSRFFTLAALERRDWPAASLGEELMRDHLGKVLAMDAAVAHAARGDTVIVETMPKGLPAGTRVICASGGDVLWLRDAYPHCAIVGPEELVKVRDAVIFTGGQYLTDSQVNRVLDSVDRTLVWVNSGSVVPKAVLQRHSGTFGKMFKTGIALERVRVGPSRALLVTAAGGEPGGGAELGYVDDDDYLFLCRTPAARDVLYEWFPGAIGKILTVAEAQDLVVADVYLFTDKAIRQTNACPQIVTRDRSEYIGKQVTGATRGFYLVDSPVG